STWKVHPYRVDTCLASPQTIAFTSSPPSCLCVSGNGSDESGRCHRVGLDREVIRTGVSLAMVQETENDDLEQDVKLRTLEGDDLKWVNWEEEDDDEEDGEAEIEFQRSSSADISSIDDGEVYLQFLFSLVLLLSWIDTTMDTHLSDPMGKHLWYAMYPQDFSPPFSKLTCLKNSQQVMIRELFFPMFLGNKTPSPSCKESSSHCGVGGKRKHRHLSWRKDLNGEKENQRFSLMAGLVMERTSEMVIQSPHLVQLPVRMWESH
ncbi:hypothetical protein IGI04_011200, partial [Brassica rapa subsp. trilocularis]